MKLGTKINLVLVVAVAVVLTIGSWIISGIEAQNIEKQVTGNVASVTEIVRQDVERLSAQIFTQREYLQETVMNLTQRIPGIKYVEVVDVSGKSIATTRGPRDAQSEASKLTILREVLDKKVPIFEEKIDGTQYNLEYHAPIFDFNNKIINVVETEVTPYSRSTQDIADAKRLLGLVSASVEQSTRAINVAIEEGSQYRQKVVDDASQIGKVTKDAKFGFFHDIIIFDKELEILANTGHEEGEFSGDDPEHIQARRDVISGAKAEVAYERIHEGYPVIVHVKPLKIHDMKSMQTVNGVSVHDMNTSLIVGAIEVHTMKSAYEDRIREFRVLQLVVGIVFTVTLVVVLMIILERQVVGPIRRYSIIARKIADGDLSQTVEHDSNDEIGQFGAVFNSMVGNLRELDKLKSDFISVAAHQLRTPLSGVKWVLKLLLDGDLGTINDDQKGMLKRGYETNEKMIQLVNDLLNVSRIENGKFGYKFERNDFTKLLDTLIENTVLPSKERNIEVRLENRAGVIPEFLFDQEKLLIALQNIVDNAMKYTLPGGRVTVIVEKQGDYLEVKVSDTGVGIPKADIAKLFSKFFRAANVIHLQTDGSGLGLFIVKSIIVRHGGQIWVDSEEGKGTTFTILVPVLAELLPKEDGGEQGGVNTQSAVSAE